VEHILIDCVNFALCRSKYFNASTLQEIFETANMPDLIDQRNRFVPQTVSSLSRAFERVKPVRFINAFLHASLNLF
jgi:hypothetical protein